MPRIISIDYGLKRTGLAVTDPLKKQIKDADIYPDVKHSDHCPVYLELKD